MDSADKNSLFGQYKKRFKFKQRLWNILSIVYTLILIPLLRFLDGRDYSVVWRIISVVTTVALITMNLIQSRSMKRQRYRKHLPKKLQQSLNVVSGTEFSH